MAGHSFAMRDLILLVGGLFLIFKATREIHDKVEHRADSDLSSEHLPQKYMYLLSQILLLDLVFSIDSVITAVGMAQSIYIMVTAMLLSMVVMLVSAKWISEFVDENPTIKILALSFLLLIGMLLVGEGTGQHFNKGYIYFAMAFSVSVELLNMRFRKNYVAKNLRAKDF